MSLQMGMAEVGRSHIRQLVAHLMRVDEKDTMTKKLQPSRSLRALLFGGPQFEFTTAQSMEDCIQRLQRIDERQQLGGVTCRLYALDDRGSVVRWILDTGMDTFIQGECAVQSDGRIRIQAHIGSSMRGMVSFGLFLVAMLTLIPLLWLTTRLLNTLQIGLIELAFLGGFIYIVVIALFLRVFLRLPRPVANSFCVEVCQALRALFTEPPAVTI